MIYYNIHEHHLLPVLCDIVWVREGGASGVGGESRTSSLGLPSAQ